MTTYQFKTNINCGDCIEKVSPYLNKLNGINNWKVDTDNNDKILSVDTNYVKPRDIKKAVREAGFDIEEDDSSFLGKLFGES